MAILKGSVPVMLVGIGAAIAAPMFIPAVAAVGRPLAKGAVKGMLTITDRTRELFAEVGEQWSDLVAEARAEATNGSGSEARRAARAT